MGSSRVKPEDVEQVQQEAKFNEGAKREDIKGHVKQVETRPDVESTASAGDKSANTLIIPQRSDARSSWYAPAWKSKSAPMTATARESVSAEQGVTTTEAAEKFQSSEPPKRPGMNVSQRMRGSRKSIPLVAEPTKVHATSDASSKSRSRHGSEEKLRSMDGTQDTKPTVVESLNATKDQSLDANDDSKSIASTIKPQTNAWLGGWWSRPDGYASDNEKVRKGNKRRKLDESSNTPFVSTPSREVEQSPLDHAPVSRTDATRADDSSSAPVSNQHQIDVKHASTRSWFGSWSATQNQQRDTRKETQKVEVTEEQDANTNPASDIVTPQKQPSAATQSAKKDQSSKSGKSEFDEQSRPSGWAFWSHERPKELATTPNGTQKQLGEIAVADTPSQSHPEAVQFNEQKQQSKAEKNRSKPSPKAARSNNDEKAVEDVDAKSLTAKSNPPLLDASSSLKAEMLKAETKKSKSKSVPNVVAPAFAGMYPSVSNAGYVERLAKYLAQSLSLPGASATSSNRHVMQKTSGLPKIKKCIAIGVHGFFPAPLLQRVLGPPTGTSIRFANYAAAAITEWCKQNQPDIKQVEIEKVALEGEGFIADRVNTLWKLLLNWLSQLRQADFIMIACHSQGVPVGIMLVAKLIQLGVLSSHAKIGICAMAGINLGPFLEYRSRLFAGSALELFSFCDSASSVSKSYFDSVDVCLRHGVRITYVGSLDDQLVSLESSLFMPLQHPYVHRAVFIDGRLHSPSFLTHLVVFALKLRNLGISDHGLLRELSAPLAGSLMGGEGHSRIYDDAEVYRIAIDFALESTDIDPSFAMTKIPSGEKEKAKEAAFQHRSSISGFPSSTAIANSMRRGSISGTGKLPGLGAVVTSYEPLISGANSNPFYLPWAVRGMLEEEHVEQDMQSEVGQLVQEFDEWKPQSKVLKDVKWRLEGVKSML